jgi:MoaA/NifB/PqqE/SkfB family radical SAM enzyme
MSLDTAHMIADRIKESKWNPRIEFAMHGEPLLNPNWSEIISVISTANRKLHITLLTNGSVIAKMGLPGIANSFFSAGGSTLGIDMYKERPIFAKLSQIIHTI